MTMNTSSVKSETRIATDWGWGFCTSECKQDLNQKETGVLRSLDNADILREEANLFIEIRPFPYSGEFCY